MFHDVDKLTSVFIHLCPPLVTYCLRWHMPAPHHPYVTLPAGTAASPLTVSEAVYAPIIVYAMWQVAYYLKTELLDRKKLQNDKDIMTSSRWMTIKEPHPIYKVNTKKQPKKPNPPPLLSPSLFLYTHFVFIVGGEEGIQRERSGVADLRTAGVHHGDLPCSPDPLQLLLGPHWVPRVRVLQCLVGRRQLLFRKLLRQL